MTPSNPMTPTKLRRLGLPVRKPLVDSFNRQHNDIRISLTDRCSLRCTYCMPAQGVPCLPALKMLSADEIIRIVRIVSELGINKVRLTGGEPLLRRDLVEIVARINALPQAPEIALTTNGIGLGKIAPALATAGLRRVNVSLDTLNARQFKELTRRDRLPEVFAGLSAAKAAGLNPVKINTVLLRDINYSEAPQLLEFALQEGFQLRFIEQMPLDAGHGWKREEMVTASEILSYLREYFTLTPTLERGASPAEYWNVSGVRGRCRGQVGVIAAVTRPFCRDCNRIRLTADGQLRSCLFAREETNLRDLLRSACDDAVLEDAIRACIWGKPAGHDINSASFVQPVRPMSAIGG